MNLVNLYISTKQQYVQSKTQLNNMNNNIEEKSVAEVLTSKKEYKAPSIHEYGDITKLVNGQVGVGGDGGGAPSTLS